MIVILETVTDICKGFTFQFFSNRFVRIVRIHMVHYRMTTPMIILESLNILLKHLVFIPEDNFRTTEVTEPDTTHISHTDIVEKKEDVIESIEVISIHDDIVNINNRYGNIRKIERLAIVADRLRAVKIEFREVGFVVLIRFNEEETVIIRDKKLTVGLKVKCDLTLGQGHIVKRVTKHNGLE